MAEIVRRAIALATLALGCFVASVDYAFFTRTRHRPPGAEYTEHLYVIGGVSVQPIVVIAAGAIVAALLFALGLSLIVTRRD
jgi:hypothetical protein